MKCGIKCPNWYFRLNFPTGLGPICKKYKLPLFDARDKCVKETGKEVKRRGKYKQSFDYWPGSLRGFGPITMKIGKEK